MSENQEIQPENLTAKEVGDFSKEVGKDIGKQTIVWVFASLLTKGIRGVIDKMVKNGSAK